MFINKKIGLTFLLVLLFLLIGGSTAFAYTGYGSFEYFEGYVDFSLGVDFGIRFNAEDDTEFNWGFNSSSFNGDIGGNPDLYLSFYMTLYHGDMNTGEGYIVFATWYRPERGISSAQIMLFDFLGYGNHLWLVMFDQYHNKVEGLLSSAVVYGIAEFEITVDHILGVWVIDFQNNGIRENGIPFGNTSNGIVVAPHDFPDSWVYPTGPYVENPNLSADTWFFVDWIWLINQTTTFRAEIGPQFMRTPFNTVDEKIAARQDLVYSGYTLEEANIWYGSYVGMPDNEKIGAAPDLSITLSASIESAIPGVGSGQFGINGDFGIFYHASSEAGVEGTFGDKLAKFDFGFTGEFIVDSLAALPGFLAGIEIDFQFIARKEMVIEGEDIYTGGNALEMPKLPFKAKRAEVILNASWRLPIALNITPKLNAVLDFAELINAANEELGMTDPYLAWSVEIGADFAFDMGQIIVPVYVRLSNIPLKTYQIWLDRPYSYRLTYGEGIDPSGMGNVVADGPDENIRMFFGTGIKFSL